jgi:hypothetical protein
MTRAGGISERMLVNTVSLGTVPSFLHYDAAETVGRSYHVLFAVSNDDNVVGRLVKRTPDAGAAAAHNRGDVLDTDEPAGKVLRICSSVAFGSSTVRVPIPMIPWYEREIRISEVESIFHSAQHPEMWHRLFAVAKCVCGLCKVSTIRTWH